MDSCVGEEKPQARLCVNPVVSYRLINKSRSPFSAW